MLREYVISEAMHALGIPTTRSLAVVTTGEPVYRETAAARARCSRAWPPATSASARSSTRRRTATPRRLRALADYTIARHYPGAGRRPGRRTWRSSRRLLDRQASLIAQWQLVGFIHGVMNTDNMAISGETIDYGPCAFMDAYDPATVFSSIDHGGRYAYGNQPAIAQWNLARFAETLLPLLDADTRHGRRAARTEALDAFPGAVRAPLARRHARQAGAVHRGGRRRRAGRRRC